MKDEIKGKVSGDKSEEMKGKAEQTIDKAKRTGRDVRDDVKEMTDEQRAEREREREADTVKERRSW